VRGQHPYHYPTAAVIPVVYGVYPVAAPLITAGLSWAIVTGSRAQWRACGTAVAVAVVGTAAAFAGPAGAWAVAGLGLCLLLLASAVVSYRQQRA
jgi:hypothetical protein